MDIDFNALQQQANELGDPTLLHSTEETPLEKEYMVEDPNASFREKGEAILKANEEMYKENPEEGEENPKETPEEIIARLTKELEEAKAIKEKPSENPLSSVEEKAKEKGVDIEKYVEEFTRTGELSKEALKDLEKAGFNEVAINAYKEARMAQEERKVEGILQRTVGTKDNYGKLVEWIGANKTPEEIAIYEEAVLNEKFSELAIKAMWAESGLGKVETPQTILRGDNLQTIKTESEHFKSTAEMIKAMSDPRYGVEPKYTKMVREKTARMK